MKGSSKSDMNAVIEDPKSPQSQLTIQQQKFVDLYCSAEDLSQTEAARRAGYKYPALSGHQLLRKPHVVACIDEKRREIGHKYRITPERKARDLINIQHKAQEEGKGVPQGPHEWPLHDGRVLGPAGRRGQGERGAVQAQGPHVRHSAVHALHVRVPAPP